MSVVPVSVRAKLVDRLERHVRRHWADRCERVSVRFAGRFAYVDAITGPTRRSRRLGLDPLVRLCRLAYLGGEEWGFGFYKYSDEKYESSFLPTGSLAGTPEECFDCAANLYLQDTLV